MVKVYVASSWRNGNQKAVVEALRLAGFEVYDFKNPHPGNRGFHWTEIDPDWRSWTGEEFRESLDNPLARLGYQSDFEALQQCDACVLLNPCGRSAHLELGYAAGFGKTTFILLNEGDEPELMYSMADYICLSLEELIQEMQRFYLLDLPKEAFA